MVVGNKDIPRSTLYSVQRAALSVGGSLNWLVIFWKYASSSSWPKADHFFLEINIQEAHPTGYI